MLEWNPSYDFELFNIRDFSPLQMQEYGAQTSFRASDPTGYVDFALNQLRALTSGSNPLPYLQRQYPTAPIAEPALSFFQSGNESAVTIRERAIQVRDEAQKVIDKLGGNPATFPSGGNTGGATSNCTMKKCDSNSPFWARLLGPMFGGCCIGEVTADCRCLVQNDGETQLATPGSQKVADTAKSFFTSIPGGGFTFIIAILALIFLLLFARR